MISFTWFEYVTLSKYIMLIVKCLYALISFRHLDFKLNEVGSYGVLCLSIFLLIMCLDEWVAEIFAQDHDVELVNVIFVEIVAKIFA